MAYDSIVYLLLKRVHVYFIRLSSTPKNADEDLDNEKTKPSFHPHVTSMYAT